jgi:hypothetical protein
VTAHRAEEILRGDRSVLKLDNGNICSSL